MLKVIDSINIELIKWRFQRRLKTSYHEVRDIVFYKCFVRSQDFKYSPSTVLFFVVFSRGFKESIFTSDEHVISLPNNEILFDTTKYSEEVSSSIIDLNDKKRKHVQPDHSKWTESCAKIIRLEKGPLEIGEITRKLD